MNIVINTRWQNINDLSRYSEQYEQTTKRMTNGDVLSIFK